VKISARFFLLTFSARTHARSQGINSKNGVRANFADEWERRSVFRRGVRARAGEMIKFEQQQGELKDYMYCINGTDALVHQAARLFCVLDPPFLAEAREINSPADSARRPAGGSTEDGRRAASASVAFEPRPPGSGLKGPEKRPLPRRFRSIDPVRPQKSQWSDLGVMIAAILFHFKGVLVDLIETFIIV
jgi:hypothetical protein